MNPVHMTTIREMSVVVPNFNMCILLTGLHTFLMVLVVRIGLNIKTILVIISLFPLPVCLNKYS